MDQHESDSHEFAQGHGTISDSDRSRRLNGEQLVASEWLLRHKLRINDQILATEGYRALAEIGHDVDRRNNLYGKEIPTPVGSLKFKGTGFRGVVYLLGDVVLKTNFFMSHEVMHEARILQRAQARLTLKSPDSVWRLEQLLAVVSYPSNEPPIVSHKLGECGDFFGEEAVLVKAAYGGLNASAIMDRVGPDWFTNQRLIDLALCFREFAKAGVLLQGDPTDFISSDRGWIAVDADGWVLHKPDDPYCIYAARRNYCGVFTRDWAPDAPARAAMSKDRTAGFDALLERVAATAESVFPGIARPFSSPHFERLLAEDDLLAPNNPVLRSLIRYEVEDPFRLDNALGSCNICVLLSRRDVYERLLQLRRVDKSFETFYFQDLRAVEEGEFIVFYQPYNDATAISDHIPNHTGVTNRRIAEQLLRAANATS